MSEPVDYSVNFFSPKTGHAKDNMKLTIFLILIWFFAVFGIQFYMAFNNTPKPEKSYALYKDNFDAVKDASANRQQLQDFSKSILFVLGKNFVVSDAERAELKTALSSVIKRLDASAVAGQDGAVAKAVAAVGLGDTGFDPLLKSQLQFALVETGGTELTNADKLPAIMDKYLIHNSNIFTEMRFLGFPFHYWYTAQFLLILFVVLCLIYAIATDRIHKKHNFDEELEAQEA